MYRRNMLKEELDRLREENKRLLLENVFLRERNNTLQSEIRNMRLEIHNRSLMDSLQNEILLKPTTIRINKEDKDDIGE